MATIPTKKISEITTLLSDLTKETLVAVAEDDGAGGYVTKKVDLRDIDDVQGYTDFASFPATGSTETLYLTTTENKLYFWDGAAYVDLFQAAHMSYDNPGLTATDVKAAIDEVYAESLQNMSEDTAPALGGELNAGLHSIGFTEKNNTSSAGAVTIDWKTSNKQKITLTENTTFSFTNPSQPCNLVLRIIQDATGGWTVTLPTIKTAGGTGLTFSTTAGAEDILMLYFDGANYIASLLQDIK